MTIVKTGLQAFDSQLMEEREYWLDKLAGETPVSNLRLDYARPAAYSPARESLELTLDDELSRRLFKVTGGSPFLIYTALLTGLNVCLYKYTNSRRVIVGSPARRAENGAGRAENALAILNEIEPRESFRNLLMRVRETLTEAYARQKYPLQRIVRDLGLEQPENECAVFDIAIALTDLHEDLPELKNDITLLFSAADESVTGRVEYNGGLFARETVERFAGHLTHLLARGLADVNRPVSELEILTEAERLQILVGWNDTRAEFSDETCIHRLFEEQAARTPDNLALVSDETELTYAELNRRANRLAHHLRGLGVGPESPVGLLMENSPEAVVGLLGILKAGGVYVPMDTAYPAERLTWMMKDSGAKVLLTQSGVEVLPEHDARLVCPDARREAPAAESAENPSSEVLPENGAYVIYTSGSTGRPKGVLLAHRGLCNMVEAQVRAFRVEARSRVLQFASLGFDASVSEIFMALTAGAALYFGRRDDLVSPAHLTNLLRGRAITTVTLPPSLLAVLGEKDLPALQTVISAGESCPAEVAARWSVGRTFINAYGPSEITVCASLFECGEDYQGAPPIGRGIANTGLYLLDDDLNPVPPGVTAHLYVAGPGLARAYLRLPALTAASFIPHPFSPHPGRRLYRTGDLARSLPDGRVEYVGRADRQVKLRGYRIELEEVEAALSEAGGVAQAACLVRGEGARARLVAYVVLRGGAKAEGLRGRLRGRLPEYMLPQAIVEVAEMPLTHSGKIDRRRLPAPDNLRPELTAAYVMPRTELERTIAGVWQEVLQVDKVGTHDNFFDLGGHSLLLVRVHSKLAELLPGRLSILNLFEYPTVDSLARFLTRQAGDDSSALQNDEQAEQLKRGKERQGRLRALSREASE